MKLHRIKLWDILDRARRPEDRAALLRQAGIIRRGARVGLTEAEDYHVVEDRLQAIHLLPVAGCRWIIFALT